MLVKEPEVSFFFNILCVYFYFYFFCFVILEKKIKKFVTIFLFSFACLSAGFNLLQQLASLIHFFIMMRKKSESFFD